MIISFYLFSFFSVFFTLLTILTMNVVHSLLFFILSLICVSGIFFSIGAFFEGVFEIIIYAGAIMVLFLFSIMLIDLKECNEKTFLLSNKKNKLLFYFSFFLIIFISLLYPIFFISNKILIDKVFTIKKIGFFLFGSHFFIVEFISLILLSAIFFIFLLLIKKIKNN